MSIIGKIDADITIDLSEKMIQKFPNGSTGAGAMVDAGYAKREGDRLICKIIFAKGELTVNGKPQAIPGLGGPPSGRGRDARRRRRSRIRGLEWHHSRTYPCQSSPNRARFAVARST